MSGRRIGESVGEWTVEEPEVGRGADLDAPWWATGVGWALRNMSRAQRVGITSSGPRSCPETVTRVLAAAMAAHESAGPNGVSVLAAIRTQRARRLRHGHR